jgi:hypothetical protein
LYFEEREEEHQESQKNGEIIRQNRKSENSPKPHPQLMGKG